MKKLLLLALTLTAFSAQAQNKTFEIVEAKVGEPSYMAKAMNVDTFELNKLVVKHDGKLYNCVGRGSGIRCRKVDEAKK